MNYSKLKTATLLLMSLTVINVASAEDNKPTKDGITKVGDYKKVDCSDKTKCGSDWDTALPDKRKPSPPPTSKRKTKSYNSFKICKKNPKACGSGVKLKPRKAKVPPTTKRAGRLPRKCPDGTLVDDSQSCAGHKKKFSSVYKY